MTSKRIVLTLNIDVEDPGSTGFSVYLTSDTTEAPALGTVTATYSAADDTITLVTENDAIEGTEYTIASRHWILPAAAPVKAPAGPRRSESGRLTRPDRESRP